jgi:hypothetical protein
MSDTTTTEGLRKEQELQTLRAERDELKMAFEGAKTVVGGLETILSMCRAEAVRLREALEQVTTAAYMVAFRVPLDPDYPVAKETLQGAVRAAQDVLSSISGGGK